MDQHLTGLLDPDPLHTIARDFGEPSNRLSSDQAASVRLAQRLDRFFNRSRTTWGQRDTAHSSPLILAALLDGRASITATRLPLLVCLYAATQDVARWGNESEDHARLKLAATCWMRSEGASDAKDEVRGVNGIADAYSASARWIVECGSTPFGKVAASMLWEEAPRFTLIPYQKLTYDDGEPRQLIALDFTWDASLTDELEDARMAGLRRCAAALDLDFLPSTLTGAR